MTAVYGLVVASYPGLGRNLYDLAVAVAAVGLLCLPFAAFQRYLRRRYSPDRTRPVLTPPRSHVRPYRDDQP